MRTLTIFVSSPGDVAEERSRVKVVIERLQHRFRESVKLKPVFWEHLAFLAHDNYQNQIPKPAEHDIFIMILNMRIGSRLPEELIRADGTRYLSGSEFEFENAMEGVAARGFPRTCVYRKAAQDIVIAPHLSREQQMEFLEQKHMVDDFETKWCQWSDGTSRRVFRPFKTVTEFEELVEPNLHDIILAILREEGLAETESADWEGSPFRGLQRFELEHRAIYFGRSRATEEVLERLRQASQLTRPFLIVFGKSGVGKSSFLRAGVLPSLIEPGVIGDYRLWRHGIFAPSETRGDLIDGLANVLLGDRALPELKRS